MNDEECSACHRDDFLFQLYKCPICFKRCCERCALRRAGRVFCSPMCATEYFFGYLGDETFNEKPRPRRVGA